MIKRLSILLILLGTVAQAQLSRVYFTDKGSNVEMLTNPYLFLSPKAIDNKQMRGVSLDHSDLPVADEYINALRERGLEVKVTSRWFNYALVDGEDVLEKVSALSFVRRVETPRKYKVEFAKITEATASGNLVYGFSGDQINMVEGEFLHNMDYRGQGMTIAVIDGGFIGANTLRGLDSLWGDNRVLGTYNFIDGDTNVFKDGTHGTSVLSILAGFIDSSYVGSAIDANYWLLKSEDQSSETPVEMDYWLAAAEFADSVGADIITSSLGYNTFDGGVGNLTLNDIDGNTALVTKAADMAAAKGLLVVVSAGNEGNNEWGRITAPADGDSVLAVGGVDWYGTYATFSSRGPTADGRIKPDVVAVGQATAYIHPAGPTYGNGTSFSCPIISGMAACLWQEKTSLSNMDIFEAIRTSAHLRYTPNMSLGFGIPNFRLASWSIGLEENIVNKHPLNIFPNPIGDEFSVESELFPGENEAFVTILDMNGKPVFSKRFEVLKNKITVQAILPEGLYLLNIQIGDKVFLHKIKK